MLDINDNKTTKLLRLVIFTLLLLLALKTLVEVGYWFQKHMLRSAIGFKNTC